MGLPWNVNASMGGAGVNYQIQRSLRFRNSASAYLSRTPASNGNQTKWTVSFWYKPGRFGSQQPIITSYTSVTNYGIIGFSLNAFYNANDTLKFLITSSNVAQLAFETTAVYRDPSAWYHVVISVDTTQATSTNRVLIYVNGVQVTSFITATYPALNASLVLFNTTNPQQIGALATGTYGYYDGYMAEFNWIDGQQLTAASFGYNDPVTGVWQPAPFKGTYGTNGFYLPFTDIATTSGSNFGLGRDYSGNANYFNTNNISVTAGSTYDSMIDSPTSFSDGSTYYNRGNYATLNPLNTQISGSAVLQNANLQLNATSATYVNSKSTITASSLNCYCEMTVTTQSGSNGLIGIGVGNSIANIATGDGSYITYRQNGQIISYPGNILVATVSSYTQGDIIGMTATSSQVAFYKNNSLQGTYNHNLSGDFFVVGMAYNATNTAVVDFNFGQRPFTYTPPTGFKALNTFNLPTPTIPNGAAYMAATLYTGNGSSQSIVNSQNNGGNNPLGKTFYADFLIQKARSAATDNIVYDTNRGANYLVTNTTAAEVASGIIALNSTGFNVGSGTAVNANGTTYVGWQWNAGSGSSSSNTSGSITSTVSANTTAGFSVVTYTESGTYTVGHGLGVAPSMIMLKERNAVGNWIAWQNYWTAPTRNGVYLNATNTNFTTGSNWLNSTTSTVFGITGGQVTSGSSQIVAYCFAAVKGYSAFGNYTGNASTDGPFIYLGFRPRFLMVKRTDVAENWYLIDSSRNVYNVLGELLEPNLSNAGSSTNVVDFLSNGFKVREAGTGFNGSGGNYIYSAFAENPFNYSRAR